MVSSQETSVAVSRRGSSDPSGDLLRTVVWVRGDHDVATRVDVSGALSAATHLDTADLVVDLSGITFMDASTIGAIVSAHNRLRANSRSLSVRAPSSVGLRLLDICGLSFLVEGERALTVHSHRAPS